MKILGSLILLLTALVAFAGAQTLIYPCSIDYVPYNLDDAPTTSGVSAGEYATGKQAYVGLGSWKSMSYNAGRLQLSPPGIWVPTNGKSATLMSTPGYMWYIRAKPNQTFTWVPSQNAQTVPNAVDFGTNIAAGPYYFGRVVQSGTVSVGIVPLFMGRFFYADNGGNSIFTATGYQVLTCVSTIDEAPTSPPSISSTVPNADDGCIHNWVAYNNDREPATKGIPIGELDCNNNDFVGKGNPNGPWRPGRIQITGNAGLYVLHEGAEKFLTSGAEYLVDNPSYTYKWVTYAGTLPSNAVQVRNNIGGLAFAVTRMRIDGNYRVGWYVGKESNFPTNGGTSSTFFNYYEVLTCDPVPRYRCAQTWKKYALDSAPSTDGINAGAFKGIDIFVGRGTRKSIHGCRHHIGRIQIAPASAAGVYYTEELSNSEVFDNVTGEYLVKNVADTYMWTPSNDGDKVPFALEMSSGGHPFYIGVTITDYNVYVGKVLPRKGLFYVDINGRRRVTNSYGVLTCFSSTKPNSMQ